ncbi:zinc finger protein 423 [Aedes aegypti]|uniref:C2H2-type domain-containing protein n=1 Tax=Aedes aegypti TaxID=7159 RepID=A0A1S4FBN8_AEDAE|nr:zinc finger protein 423 [Aedes aegypti]
MANTAEQTKGKRVASTKCSSLQGISKPKVVPSNSIVLEQNGEKKILKKVKLKAPPKSGKKLPPESNKSNEKNTGTQETAAGKPKFVCTFCKVAFHEQEALKKHFLKHGNQSQIGKNPDQAAGSGRESTIDLIECEWCPETFTQLSRAIEHKYRKHNYESKNYFCTLCGKLFPLKVALDQHQNSIHKHDMKMNVPRLDFICGFCGTAFISESALDSHVKTAHNLEKRMMAHPFIPNPSKKVRLNQAGEIISIYYCHLCGSEYMLKFNLLKHIEDHHSYEDRCAMPEDMLKCSTCDSMFYTKKAFDAHNVHHKPEDLYVTSEEQRLNIVARVDQDFDFRRVPTALDKALGSLSSSSTDSAVTLAKKHGGKAKRAKGTSSTATNNSALKLHSSGEVNGIDVLKMLLEGAGK